MCKYVINCLLVVLLVVAFSGNTFADQAAGEKNVVTDISSLKDRIASEMKTLLANDVRDHAKMMKELKKAGASYIPKLTTPLSKASAVKDKDTQRILWGMYSFDTAYATMFGKKKEMAERIRACDDLARSLNLSASVMPAMKKLAQKKGQITIDDVTDTLAKEIEAVLPQISDKPKDVEFWADAAYGGVVQGIYIVTELIAANDYRPEMLALLSSQKEHLSFLEAVELFKPHSKAGKMAQYCKRFQALEPIHQILLNKNTYTKDDCEKARALITKVRNQILAAKPDGDCE
jgi:DNA-binding ferritin-like protein